MTPLSQQPGTAGESALRFN